MKIVSSKRIVLSEPVEVCDLTVAGYSNFKLAAGAIVHNSKDCSDSACCVVAGLLSRREVWGHFGIPPSEMPEQVKHVIKDSKDTEKVSRD